MLRAQHASCVCRHEFQAWDTAYVRRTVQVLNPDDNTSALGAPFGSIHNIKAQMRQAVESSSELRQAILSVDHAPTEVVLSARMSPNLPTTCAATETEWTTHCWPFLTPVWHHLQRVSPRHRRNEDQQLPCNSSNHLNQTQDSVSQTASPKVVSAGETSQPGRQSEVQ